MKKLSVFVILISICVFTLTGCFGEPRTNESNDDGEKNGTDSNKPAPTGQECVIEFVPPPTFAVSAVNVKGMSGSELTPDGKIIGAYSVLGDCKVAKEGTDVCKLDKLEENARVMDVNLEIIANGQVFYACYSDGATFQDFGSFALTCGETKYKVAKVSNGVNGCNYRVVFYGTVETPDGGAVADTGTTTDSGITTDTGIVTDAGTIDPGTQYVGNFVVNCVPPSGYSSCTMYVGYGIVQNGAQSDKLDMTAVSGKAIPANDLCHSWWSPNAAEFALKAIRTDGSSSWVRNPDGNIVLLDPRGTRVPLRQLSKAENVGTGLPVDMLYCRNPAY